jgi:hypothetical protein
MTNTPTKEQIRAAADRAEARSRGESPKEFCDTAMSEGAIDAEIKRLAALPEGVFESSRKAALDRLPEGWRGSVLDRLVRAERSKIAKAGNDFLPHWKVEASPGPVDGAALLDALRKHFSRYVVLPPHADVVLALWTLHTWVFDCFDITPYLAITSPTRRCGKTLLMTMLYWLCCRAKKNDSMSKAAIYRSVDRDKPTLCLDEVAWVVDLRDERQNILCGGFERLGHAEVCEGEGADIAPRLYSTFSPKCFGLIGKLTATLMDRAIEIAMQRKLNEKVERLRRRDNDDHTKFRRQSLRWAQDNREVLATMAPKAPEGLNDRAIDIWEPLLAIAEHVSGDWPKLASDAAVALSGGEAASEERSVELLVDMKAAFEATERDELTTKALVAALCADEERPWATYNKGKPISDRQVAKLLKQFAIISETIHPPGERHAKGYKKVGCLDAFERCQVPANPRAAGVGGLQACERASVDKTGTSDAFCERAETVLHGYEKCEKPANGGGLHACTDKNPQAGHAATNGGDEDDGSIPDFLRRAYQEELEARAAPEVRPPAISAGPADNLDHLTISAKSYLEVIADELFLRGETSANRNGATTVPRSS